MDAQESRKRIVALWLETLQPDESVRDMAGAWILAQGDIQAAVVSIRYIPSEEHLAYLWPLFARLAHAFWDHQKWASDV